MLVIRRAQLEAMAEERLEEIASELHRKAPYIARDEASRYVSEKASLGFTQSLELQSLATSLWAIQRAGFDMGKIRSFLSRDDLSKDHKLVPLRMLAEILLGQEKDGHQAHPNM
jgi:hypothetical protein